MNVAVITVWMIILTNTTVSSLDDSVMIIAENPEGNVEVADELFNGWIPTYSKYDGYPDYGEYGNTYNIDGWSVETSSSIYADEGARLKLFHFPTQERCLKK